MSDRKNPSVVHSISKNNFAVAKTSIHTAMSVKAMEILQAKKQEIASALINNGKVNDEKQTT